MGLTRAAQAVEDMTAGHTRIPKPNAAKNRVELYDDQGDMLAAVGPYSSVTTDNNAAITLAPADVASIYRSTKPIGAVTITCPADADIPPGAMVLAIQEAAAPITAAAGTGATLIGDDTTTNDTGQALQIIKLDDTTWWAGVIGAGLL